MTGYYAEKSGLPLFDQPPDPTRDKIPWTDQDRQRAASKQERLLEFMRDGRWHTTIELSTNIGHRFSASLYSLREQGHRFAKQPTAGGNWRYRYLGRTPLHLVTEHLRDAYYRSTHWRAWQAKRLRFDGYRCCMCKREDDLVVHHWRFELFNETLADLMTLCRRCHREIHQREPGEQHFPRKVDEPTLQRLQQVAQVAQAYPCRS